MSFSYASPGPAGQTPLSPSGKGIQCKSFRIDIAAGSQFVSGTETTIGFLPAGAQVIIGNVVASTAVSGGTVSAATLTVRANLQSVSSGVNVFTQNTGTFAPQIYFSAQTWDSSRDVPITYIPTLTGAGPTAGVIYINVLYVM